APAAGASAPVAPAPVAPAQPSASTVQASSEAETTVENDLYRIRFTNRGGQVKSWVLKKFTDDQRQPLELIHSASAQKYGYPLSLWVYDESLRNKLNTALFVGRASGTLSAPAEIVFEYSDAEVSVRKAFHFDHTYVVKVETSVLYKGGVVSAFPMWPAGF